MVAAPDPKAYLAAYAGVQRATDAEILRVLRDAYKDVNTQLGRLASQRGPGAEVRRAQLLAIKRMLLEEQGRVFERTGKIIEKRRVEAAARAIRVAGRYDEAVFSRVGRTEDARELTRALEAVEPAAIDVAVARLNGSSVPLSQRVYRAQLWSAGTLERRVNSALARGLTAEEFAREARDWINPNTPGGVRYAALRLARTELNNAYHAMAIQAAIDKPWINKVEWHKSASHRKKDECDVLDGQLFKPEDTPRKPHPMCLCYITPTVQQEEGQSQEETDDAFLDALAGGDFDDFLQQHGTS